ncbi:GNAT family N-acetyltransferase [Georgenia faecalis]|uniref:GNAT family N-acetyltransferase n=1 Tax=Georgenia faecalis TaxID=2483799 RepID=A0ABV9DC19_9MICO|nr:GNAT family N-acetyltransferase [Georgenia faecalis]
MTAPHARIRPATADDAAGLAALQATCWRQTYAGTVPEHVLADRERTGLEWWQRRLADPGGASTWVATRAGELLGFAVAEAVGPGDVRPLRLRALYVLAQEHGTGLGQALLDTAVGDAPCFLWVAEENPRAHAFYRRNGFEPDGAREIAERWGGVAGVRLVR